MNQKLAEKCIEALKSSPYWTNKTKDNGRTIQNLTCPACDDKTAWAYKQEPYAICCNRGNECNARTKTIELFNITLDIEKEYKPTKEDPNRPVREYLKSRSINDSVLQGLDCRYWKKTRKGCGGGAMFLIGKDENGQDVFNGRLLNPPKSVGKTHNHNSTSGLFWQHPGIKIDPSKHVYITEGVIDALSIICMKKQAVAVLSSGQDPAKLKGLEKYNLITAFDNDHAGTRATKNYLNHFPNSEAIMPPRGKDWNDILREDPETAEQRFKENKKQYLYNAELALSNTNQDYAQCYYDHHERPIGLFLFDGCTYFSTVRTKGENTTLIVERVGKFTIEVQSFINIGSTEQKEFLYQLKVIPKAGRPISCTATGKQLATAKDLKSFLLSHAKVSYEGTPNSTQALITRLIDSKAPEVRRALYTGLDPESNWYIFNTWAIDSTGKLHQKSKSGLFDTGTGSTIMPAPQASEKAIEPAKKPKQDAKNIYNLIHKAWGDNGATALSWVIAGWFVNLIKDKENFYPHISLYGDPAAGKSALTSKLQALQGRDTEGLPLSQLNTKKGLARTIAGFSNIFTALLEDSQRNDRAFDYSILLTAYNKGSLQVQAKFTNTLETSENSFLSTLMFVQNSEPFNQKAEKQRVISLLFKTEDLNGTTKQAFNEVNSYSKEELASFMVEVLQHRQTIEAEWYNEYKVACADLEAVEEERIRNNHGLLLGFHRLFCRLFSIESDIFSHVEAMALEKQNSSAELEINDATTFFETVFSLDSKQTEKYWHEVYDAKLKTTLDYNSLYFNLPELIRLLQNYGLNPPRSKELQEALRQHPAYLSHGKNHRFPTNENETHTVQRKAWCFDLDKFKKTESPPEPLKNNAEESYRTSPL
jgi:Toprim-like